MAEPEVAKEGPTAFPDCRWSDDPAIGFGIEFPQLLQFPVLFFGQKLDAHVISHAHRAVRGFVLLPRLQRFMVITDTSAAFRAFCGAIIKHVFAGLFVKTD